MFRYNMWAQDILSWLSAHGFQFNNREKAALLWSAGFLLLFVAILVGTPRARSSLLDALKLALTPPLRNLWFLYLVWIVVFVGMTKYLGIWRTVLTKDTVVWTATAGLVLLSQFPRASDTGYFRQSFFGIVDGIVLVEYLLNLLPFSLLVEVCVIQPALLIVIFSQSVGNRIEGGESLSHLSTGIAGVLLLVSVIHTGLVLRASWSTIDWSLSVLQGVWPLLLGVWTLGFVYLVGSYSTYEQAFLKLEQKSDSSDGLWKAKIGVMLALHGNLPKVRKTTESRAYEIARTKTVYAAYRATKDHSVDNRDGH